MSRVADAFNNDTQVLLLCRRHFAFLDSLLLSLNHSAQFLLTIFSLVGFSLFLTLLDSLVQPCYILDQIRFLTATFGFDRLQVSVKEASFIDLRGDPSS